MRKVNPVIDRDLEDKAFRLFLALIETSNLEPSSLVHDCIDYAATFNEEFSNYCSSNPIAILPTEPLAEYHPESVYDSQI